MAMLASASASATSSRSTYSAIAQPSSANGDVPFPDGGDADGEGHALPAGGVFGGDADVQLCAGFVEVDLALDFAGVDRHELEGGVGDTEVGDLGAGAAFEAAQDGDVGGGFLVGVLLAGLVAGALHTDRPVQMWDVVDG